MRDREPEDAVAVGGVGAADRRAGRSRGGDGDRLGALADTVKVCWTWGAAV